MKITTRYLNTLLAVTSKRISHKNVFTKSSPDIPPVRKTVIVSTSNDIYTNLALEQWIYGNTEFANDHMLMLWVNNPCIVIGRHQNPWAEANIFKLEELGVQLARRNSGGGTVYHDLGNLNLTFFTPRKHYSRINNLEFIVDSVNKDFGLKLDISPKDDITLRDFKVSGTAAKLAGNYAYHHCTLLVKAATETLKKSLKPIDWDIKSNATKSTRSKTTNLCNEAPDMEIEHLIRTLGIRYLNQNNANLGEVFGNIAETNKSFSLRNESFKTGTISTKSIRLQLVDPVEANFPGIAKIRDSYTDWQWTYGRTPKFELSKGFKVELKTHPHTTNPHEVQKIIFTQSRTYVVLVKVSVEEGMVVQVHVQMPTSCTCEDMNHKLETALLIRGSKFSEETLKHIEKIFGEDAHEIHIGKEAVLNKAF